MCLTCDIRTLLDEAKPCTDQLSEPPTNTERKPPKVETLMAKQHWMEEEQYETLHRLAREKQKARERKGESITPSMLIRIFTDLGIKHYATKLKGSTELELRKSVGLQ